MIPDMKPVTHNGELVLSVGTSRKDTNWRPARYQWSDLLRRLASPLRTSETVEEYAAMTHAQKGEVKDVGGFVGGTVWGNRKGGNVSMRQLLTLDADYGTMELWDAWTAMYAEAAAVYSTHSHTPESPRLRFLIPLARGVDKEEYGAIARLAASWMGIESFDDTTYEPNRLMYWPSCPKDGEYLFDWQDGPWLDPDEVLAQYDNWHDMSQWPVSSRQKSKLRKGADKQGDPMTKPGVVGAFNRAYTITQAIERFLPDVYAPAGDGRYTYTSGHTVGGLVLYDGDSFAYSHHDTDPASGMLCNAFDLVRVHLYGEQDSMMPEDTPMPKRPSFAAMQQLIASDSRVRDELKGLRSAASEDFSAEYTQLDAITRDFTEQGNAVKFAERFRSVLRYCPALGWMYWDGEVWNKDAQSSAQLLAMRFADDLLGEAVIEDQLASDEMSKKAAKKAIEWANKSRGKRCIDNMLGLARALMEEPDQAVFDPDPWQLNTPAGVVDLRTGEVKPHDSACMCTMITSVAPDPEMPMPLFTDFLNRLTNNDPEYVRYLQIMAGMAAVGKVYEEGMVISHGPGGNGKSTLFGAWLEVLGTYAVTIRPELLMSRVGGQEIIGLAEVRGKRLVIAAETEEGAKMSVSVMKRLTSRDPISARALYKDPMTFVPTHTLVMHTNFLPRLRSLDGGTRRRMAIAPFTMSLKPDEVIKDFGDKLIREEGPAILRWIIEGAMIFHKAHMTLDKPAVVRQATEDYLRNEDWLNNFLTDCCVVEDGAAEYSAKLYAAYKQWAEQNTEYRRSSKDFAAELEKRGFERKRFKQGVKVLGVKVAEVEELGV